MPAVVEIVVVVASYLVVAVFGMRVLSCLGFDTARGGENRADWAPLAAAIAINLVIAVIVVVEHLVLAARLADLRAGFDAADFLWAILGAGLLFGVAASYAWLAGAARAVPSAGGTLATLLATALFCAALMEEITFRAVIIGALMPFGLWGALLVSSVVFALIHLPTNTVTGEALAGWLMGGLAFAGAWLAGAPLVVVTAWHFAHNMGNVLWVQPSAQFGLVTKTEAMAGARLTRYAVDATLIVILALVGYRSA